MKDKKDKENNIVIHWSLRKTLTALCGIIFIPAFVLFFVSFVLQMTVVNPMYYKNNFKRIDAYNRMINQGIPSIILKTHISDNPLTDTIAKDVTTLILQKFVDPMWLEEATDTFIDTTINYLTRKNTEITLNLTSAREYLNRAAGGLLVIQELIPLCDELNGDEGMSTLCGQKAVNPDEIKKDLISIRKEIETIDLEAVKFDQVVSLINTNVSLIRTFAKDIRIYVVVSLFIMIFAALGIVVIQWQRWTVMIRSLSFFTGVGSGVTLLFGLFVNQIVPKTILQGKEIMLSPSIRAIILDFMNVSISGIFERLVLTAFVIMALSGFLFALTFLKRK